MTWTGAATWEVSGRKDCPCLGQVTSREVGNDIGQEFVWEGKLSELSGHGAAVSIARGLPDLSTLSGLLR